MSKSYIQQVYNNWGPDITIAEKILFTAKCIDGQTGLSHISLDSDITHWALINDDCHTGDYDMWLTPPIKRDKFL